ncbi:hypothetical protein SLS55_000334 [Diplodia seriata]|uniref:Uncharacterized protein n=1 Tax=Diplodia seriata TaxID=420778 RepID=A0ABR3CWI0_9PEZI
MAASVVNKDQFFMRVCGLKRCAKKVEERSNEVDVGKTKNKAGGSSRKKKSYSIKKKSHEN